MAIGTRAHVVGGGIFGLTAALALRERGYAVTIFDSGDIPHPLAASTDISKVVRIEYGGDPLYTPLAELAREGWLAWNDDLFGEPLYHETGATFLTREPMAPGGYEYENFRDLTARGHAPERLSAEAIARRYPAWNHEVYIDGYHNPKAGFVESGEVVVRLVALARARGVALRTSARIERVANNGDAVELRLASGEAPSADLTVIAAGAWTPVLLPELSRAMRVVGQPVFHLRPANPERFAPPRFLVFGADSARTGWYGFPLHPRAGVVKIANHGPGRVIDPESDPRDVLPADEGRLRAFLAESLPDLAGAPIVATRCCLYCDTPDEHFWIARHPEIPGLTVAAGDSGHAFKFAPVLGSLIADVAEGVARPDAARFAWRQFHDHTRGQEASRFRGG